MSSVQPQILKLRELFQKYNDLGINDGETLEAICNYLKDDKITENENPFLLYNDDDDKGFKQATEDLKKVTIELSKNLQKQMTFNSDIDNFCDNLCELIYDEDFFNEYFEI